MFRVRIEALETYRNATRPLIMQSLLCVQENFNLNSNVLTFFNGEAESARMVGTTNDGKMRGDQYTDIGFDDRQYIEAEIEDAEANSELDSSHRHVVNSPVWLDEMSSAMIVPNYVTKKVNVTINRYCKDRVTAQRFRDRINSQLKEPRIDVFSSSLHYPISYDIMECMEGIYNRLAKGGKIDSTKVNPLEWFKSKCKVPSDIIANIIGNNACFVFKRSVDRIRLRFDGIDIAKSIAKGRYYGQYIVSFEYSFYYAELKQWELHYPIMVQQSMIDPKWIPRDKQEFMDDYPKEMFYESLVGFNAGQIHYWNSPGMFIFPREDYGRLPKNHFLDQKLQRLAIMEDVDEQVVLNLFKFGGEEKFWNSKFKYYISTHADKVTRRHKSPFYLTLWSDDLQVMDEQIELKENGDLLLKRKPTMEATYRVALYFDYAIDQWDDETKKEIVSCETEDMGRWLLGVFFPFLPLPGDKEYTGRTMPGSCPWINWDEDIHDKLPPSPGPDNGQGEDKGPPIYSMEGFIIAKNERYYSQEGRAILGFNATDFLRRK